MGFVGRALPVGDWPLNAGPLSNSVTLPPVRQPFGGGPGGLAAVTENVAVAVAPAESVTVTPNVCVPTAVGTPSSSPDGRNVSPPGGVPDHV